MFTALDMYVIMSPCVLLRHNLCRVSYNVSALSMVSIVDMYSKTCLKRPHKKKTKLVFKTDYRLMQVKSFAEYNGSILQYFRASLSNHLSLISWFCLFLSGRLRQVLLYDIISPSDKSRACIVAMYGIMLS